MGKEWGIHTVGSLCPFLRFRTSDIYVRQHIIAALMTGYTRDKRFLVRKPIQSVDYHTGKWVKCLFGIRDPCTRGRSEGTIEEVAARSSNQLFVAHAPDDVVGAILVSVAGLGFLSTAGRAAS